MSTVHVSKDTFEAEVLACEKTVLLDFYADWCGPCKMIAPLLAEIAEERSDVKVCKVNVDEEPELAAAFHVSSIPLVVVMKEGKAVNQAVGYRSKEQLLALL